MEVRRSSFFNSAGLNEYRVDLRRVRSLSDSSADTSEPSDIPLSRRGSAGNSDSVCSGAGRDLTWSAFPFLSDLAPGTLPKVVGVAADLGERYESLKDSFLVSTGVRL